MGLPTPTVNDQKISILSPGVGKMPLPLIKLLRGWIRKLSISLLEVRYASIPHIKEGLTPRFGVINGLPYLKGLGSQVIAEGRILECFLLMGE